MSWSQYWRDAQMTYFINIFCSCSNFLNQDAFTYQENGPIQSYFLKENIRTW